jgi:hypothetical protein
MCIRQRLRYVALSLVALFSIKVALLPTPELA